MQSNDNLYISLMKQAVSKTIRTVFRDFGELQQLQSSLKGTDEFAKRSYVRIEEILTDELHTLRPDFKVVKANDLETAVGNQDFRWIIEPIEGFKNFAHALSEFCIFVALQKRVGEKYTTIAIFAEFPALEQTYYTEIGGGVWYESNTRFAQGKIRLRASQRKRNSELLVSSNFSSTNKIYFGSEIVSLIYVAAGKLDAAILKTLTIEKLKLCELFIKEAGGFFKIKNNIVIASSLNLKSKLDR